MLGGCELTTVNRRVNTVKTTASRIWTRSATSDGSSAYVVNPREVSSACMLMVTLMWYPDSRATLILTWWYGMVEVCEG